MDKLLAELRAKVRDGFSSTTMEAAEHALKYRDNPMRANFFATAMRTLFEHTMAVWSPDANVVACSWYQAQRPNGLPTRAQRIKFAIQGGLSDEFVSGQLKLDPSALSDRLIAAVDELSKHIHGRQDSIITDPHEQDEFATSTLQAMTAFFSVAEATRTEVVKPIEDALNDTAVEALMEETLQDVDELASHYSLEEVYVDRSEVLHIGATDLTYRASGSISVVMQWGSNSDLRKGDGAELEQSFPATCDITVSVNDPWDLSDAETQYGIDTSEWRKAMGPDEER